MEPAGIEPRRLQIQFNSKKIPDLINTSTTVVLPDGFTEPEESRASRTCRKRDGSCEISTTDGSSLAECISWFGTISTDARPRMKSIFAFTGPKMPLVRSRRSLGRTVRGRTSNDRKYVELGSPSGLRRWIILLCGERMEEIDRPLACWTRTFVYKQIRKPRLLGTLRHPRRYPRKSERNNLLRLWRLRSGVAESVANNPTVQVEVFDAFGKRTHLRECKPGWSGLSGFDEESIQTDSEYVLTLQTIIDPFRISGKCPVLLEASILMRNSEAGQIYFKNVLQFLEEPPTRDAYGEICEFGQLQGTRGTA